MPITQTRVLTLLDEMTKLKDSITLARQAVEEAANTAVTPQAARELRYIAVLYLKEPQLPAYHSEAAHFKAVARRNIRVADKQRRHREANGVQKREQFTSFIDLASKGASGGTEPLKIEKIPIPKTYQEFLATGEFSPQELFSMFPDEAPEPTSPDGKLDPSMWEI